jgi:hypothetical protein
MNQSAMHCVFVAPFVMLATLRLIAGTYPYFCGRGG